MTLHVWTDEDAAFAAAQWASGVHQQEVGEIFGYRSRRGHSGGSASSTVCKKINQFVRKYGDADRWHAAYEGNTRGELIKAAIAAFVAARATATVTFVDTTEPGER